MNQPFHPVEILRSPVPGAVVMNQYDHPIAVGDCPTGPLELIVVIDEYEGTAGLAVLVVNGTSPADIDVFLRDQVDPVSLAARGFDPALPLILHHTPRLSSRIDVRGGRYVPIIRPGEQNATFAAMRNPQ